MAGELLRRWPHELVVLPQFMRDSTELCTNVCALTFESFDPRNQRVRIHGIAV